jgi:transposase-like protein
MQLRSFMRKFATDEACRAHLESVRWPDGPICDRCGSINNAIPVEGRDGFWRCRDCGKQFSVTAGTPMHGTHLPLDVWYLGMYLILASSKRISAVKLGEQLGVQYRTAWHLGHRIRALLASGEKAPLEGLVEADESDIGGKVANQPKSAPRPRKRGRGTKKPMLFAAIERGGEARTLAVPSASGALFAPALWDWTGKGFAVLLTDELPTDRWLGRKMQAITASPAGIAETPMCQTASPAACSAAPGGCGCASCWRDLPRHASRQGAARWRQPQGRGPHRRPVPRRLEPVPRGERDPLQGRGQFAS